MLEVGVIGATVPIEHYILNHIESSIHLSVSVKHEEVRVMRRQPWPSIKCHWLLIDLVEIHDVSAVNLDVWVQTHAEEVVDLSLILPRRMLLGYLTWAWQGYRGVFLRSMKFLLVLGRAGFSLLDADVAEPSHFNIVHLIFHRFRVAGWVDLGLIETLSLHRWRVEWFEAELFRFDLWVQSHCRMTIADQGSLRLFFNAVYIIAYLQYLMVVGWLQGDAPFSVFCLFLFNARTVSWTVDRDILFEGIVGDVEQVVTGLLELVVKWVIWHIVVLVDCNHAGAVAFLYLVLWER